MKINGKEYVLLWTSENTNQKPSCYNLNSETDKKIILGGLYQTLPGDASGLGPGGSGYCL